jgi:hypothetical protein
MRELIETRMKNRAALAGSRGSVQAGGFSGSRVTLAYFL